MARAEATKAEANEPTSRAGPARDSLKRGACRTANTGRQVTSHKNPWGDGLTQLDGVAQALSVAILPASATSGSTATGAPRANAGAATTRTRTTFHSLGRRGVAETRARVPRPRFCAISLELHQTAILGTGHRRHHKRHNDEHDDRPGKLAIRRHRVPPHNMGQFPCRTITETLGPDLGTVPRPKPAPSPGNGPRPDHKS